MRRGRVRGMSAWVGLRFGIARARDTGRILRGEANATPKEALEAGRLRE